MEMKNMMESYDDINDIFDELKDGDIGNNYICYKESNEYGYSIKIYEQTGELIYNIFLCEDICDELQGKCITTFYNNKTKKGLFEKIFSNRSEFYINDVFTSYDINNNMINNIIKINTKMILEDKKYPELYNFISKYHVKKDITLISKNEFY